MKNAIIFSKEIKDWNEENRKSPILEKPTEKLLHLKIQ
jgi:hypothetical protein